MYEILGSNAVASLRGLNPVAFTQSTLDRILALTTPPGDTVVRFDTVEPDTNGKVTVPSGAEVVLVNSSDSFINVITPPSDAPVVIFQGRGGVTARFDDSGPDTVPGSRVDRVVVGTSGTDNYTIVDTRNTQLTLGSGNSTVHTGAGNDTVIAGLGNSTVIGGSGNAIVQLGGSAADYKVVAQDGHAIVTHLGTSKVTDISKIQYVQLDNGKALVFAEDAKQAGVATIYEAAFGRAPDSKGLDFWLDASRAGVSLERIAQDFLNSAEYKAKPAQDNQQFLTTLYQNTFNRAPDAEGLAWWTKVLDSGVSRASVLAGFVSDAGHSLDGTAAHVEPVVVGSVVIITDIL
jgi:Ca2+-binding RTX toxin-like protein